MALDATTAQQYFRLAQVQQQQYAYWKSYGDLARARLAIDAANWYYQQLGIPLYLPTDFVGYTPAPKSPDEVAAIAQTLPPPANTAGTSGGSGGGGLQSHLGGGAFDDGGDPFLQEYCAYYPDDPICSSGGGYYGGGGGDFPGGGDGGGPIYISNPTTIVINQQGATLADVSSRISGALASAAAAIATAVDSALAVAISGIQHALNAIGNELAAVFQRLARLINLILATIWQLMRNVVHGLVDAVRALATGIKDVLQHGVLPILHALQNLRDWLLKIYERYLRPLLIVLQDIRKVLAILKVFHIGFADKLDRALADIQAKISGPLLYLLRWTNGIANYINLILDWRLYIQKPLFLASLNAYKGSSLNLLINAMNPQPDQFDLLALQAKGKIPTPATSEKNLKDFLQSGGGDYAKQITDTKADLQKYLASGF